MGEPEESGLVVGGGEVAADGVVAAAEVVAVPAGVAVVAADAGEVVEPPPPRAPTELETARAELAAARSREVESHRRALLAENAGVVVPELVSGESVEALEGSLEVARAAYQRVRAEAVAEVVAGARVGAGNGVRGTALDVEAMSPMQRIAYGLRRD